MSAQLTIVMYHYVRDPAGTRFPGINALPTAQFDEQLAYLQRHHRLIGADELLDALAGGEPLPPRAALLTFDDGYAEHHDFVFPRLRERGLRACFFVPAEPVVERRVLTANKIHFILAADPDPGPVVEAIRERVDREHARWGLADGARYWHALAKPGRLDPPEVVFVKRMLQTELPEPLREALVEELFAARVTADEAGFAAELYASAEQLRTMVAEGMCVGVHGYSHRRLDELDDVARAGELERALAFLSSLGARRERWILCYPYGAHDSATIETARARGCVAGLTTRMAVADLGRDEPMLLPRVDTNYLPPRAPASRWTELAEGAG